MCAVNPPEILDRGSRCRRHSLPRHPIETLDKLRADSVILPEPEEFSEVDAGAEDFKCPNEVRLWACNKTEELEFDAAGRGTGGHRHALAKQREPEDQISLQLPDSQLLSPLQ
jgi:hypothetical protein